MPVLLAYVTWPSSSCRLGIVIAGAPAGFGVLNARILRPPRPVVKDYACPFPVPVPRGSCRLGIVIAGAPAGSGVLNARILRLPRPVVKDYACPFLLSFSVSFCSSLAKPYLVRLFHSLPSSGLRRRTLSFSGLSPGPSSQLPRTSNLPFAREIR